MRRHTVYLLAHAALLLPLMWSAGCSKHSTAPDQIIGSGRLVSESRAVAPFTGIQVTGMAKVVITQDTIQSLRIEADDNILERVTTSVAGGVLLVGLREGSYNNVTVIVHAAMIGIDRLESIGSAEFLATGPIHVATIGCTITGAGKITLAGTAQDQSVVISGAGDVHNFDLVSDRCTVLISGAGNVEVTATQQLDAVVAGTGNIVYDGHPPVVHQTVSGIGTIGPR